MTVSDRGQVPTWICSQIGAREHYAVPQALERVGALQRLLTDAWVEPNSWAATLPFKRWNDRYALGVPSAKVVAWSRAAAAFELRARWRRLLAWPLMTERNGWFQAQVTRWLRDVPSCGTAINLFSYSYAAEKPFLMVKERGWRTVLGQIDPGPVEERMVMDLCEAAGYESEDIAAPPEYWQAWEQEWRTADVVVVNSRWSREALAAEGVPQDKIRILPLAYDPPPATRGFRKAYPREFSRQRPLRLLFLGQANIRKGVLPLLESMRLLANEPVELTIVGPSGLRELRDLPSTGRVRWRGPAPRSEALQYYRDADAFVLPTFSDGFALTQLEAQAWRLPLIVSQRCGDVVVPGRNGLLLDEVTGEAIAAAIKQFLSRPSLVAAMSEESGIREEFSLESIGRNLVKMGTEEEITITGEHCA